MPRRGFNDETEDHSGDSRFDERLRSEFGRILATEEDPAQVLRELSPAFTRARRIRRGKQAVVGVAASMILFGGVGFAVRQLPGESDKTLTVADKPESEVGDTEPLEVTGTTINLEPGPSTTTTAVRGSATDGETNADDGTSNKTTQSVQQIETSATPEATVASETTTTAEPSATASATSTSQDSPGTTLIESACGLVSVSISGPTVTLVESLPIAGYTADEKSWGPESIEVSFEGGDDHCEIKAEMSDGRLDIDTD